MPRTGYAAGGVLAVLIAAVSATVVLRLFEVTVANLVIVRAAFGLCGIGFGLVAAIYVTERFFEQAIGHGLASVGFLIVAVGGEGTAVWFGVLLLGIGGGVLLQDALVRGGRGRTSV